MYLAGGVLMRVEPFGDFPTGNLTSDKATGLGNWTDDEIKRAVTKGILRDGSRLLPYPMDYGSFSTLTPEDQSALVAYLRTVPPVVNKVPPPSRPFLPVYLWGKFRMLILGADLPMVIFPATPAPKERRDEDVPEMDAAGGRGDRARRLHRLPLFDPAVLHDAAGRIRQGDGDCAAASNGHRRSGRARDRRSAAATS